MSDKCKNCNKFLRKVTGYKKVIKTEDEAKLFSDCLNNTIVVNDIFCNKCRLIRYINKNASSSRSTASDEVSVRMEICDGVNK